MRAMPYIGATVIVRQHGKPVPAVCITVHSADRIDVLTHELVPQQRLGLTFEAGDSNGVPQNNERWIWPAIPDKHDLPAPD